MKKVKQARVSFGAYVGVLVSLRKLLVAVWLFILTMLQITVVVVVEGQPADQSWVIVVQQDRIAGQTFNFDKFRAFYSTTDKNIRCINDYKQLLIQNAQSNDNHKDNLKNQK